MPTLTGTLADVTGTELAPAQIARVYVKAPGNRPSLADGDLLIVSAPVTLDLSGNLAVDLEPGPAVLVVDTHHGGPDVYELHVTADMTLLAEAVAESAPARERSWAESVMVQLRSDAAESADLADRHRAAAAIARGDAEEARDDAEVHAQEAKLNWRGNYDPATVYQDRDAIHFDGSTFRSVGEVTGVEPHPLSPSWILLAHRGLSMGNQWGLDVDGVPYLLDVPDTGAGRRRAGRRPRCRRCRMRPIWWPVLRLRRWAERSPRTRRARACIGWIRPRGWRTPRDQGCIE